MQTNVHFFIISRSILLRMRNVPDKSCRENQNTHFVFNNFFFKSYRWWDKMEKYSTAGQATDDNIAHAYCMLDSYGYKHTHTHTHTHTLRICNNFCCSTATMVVRTRLNVTLYVHCLSFKLWPCFWRFRTMWQWATLPTFCMNLLLPSSRRETTQLQSSRTTQCAVGFL